MISPHEVRRLLGPLDDEQVAEVLKLGPTLQDIEAAAVCIDGGTLAKQQLSATVSQVLEIVVPDDEAPEADR